MAAAVGIDGIHAVKGKCDLCGDECDPSAEELNVLACTFKDCGSAVYHQDCIEKYLKSIKLERNRKTGFKCPKGCGKGTTYDKSCPGKIEKSHPIHPRNEESKKRRKAKLPEMPVRPPPAVKKDKPKQDDLKSTTDAKQPQLKAKPAAQQPAVKALPLGPTPVVKQVQHKAKAKPQEQDTKKLLDIKAQLRQQLGLQTATDASRSKPPAAAPQTASRPQAPAANAWSKPTPAPTLPIPTPSPAPAARTATPTLPMPRGAQPTAPPPARAPSAAGQNPLDAPAAPPDHAPIGMEYPEVEAAAAGAPALTKAQRKNLKRLERKKRAVASEVMSEVSGGGGDGSLGSSEQDAVAVVEQAEQLELLFEMFIQALVARKVLHHIQQVSRLGFPEWQCGAAVQRHGSDLEAAVAWLLEAHLPSPEAALQSAPQQLPEVDISDDLQRLSEIQVVSCLSDRVLQQAVVDAAGDIRAAVATLLERGDIPDHAVPEIFQAMDRLLPLPSDSPLTPSASSTSLPDAHYSYQPPNPEPSWSATPAAAAAAPAGSTSSLYSWLGNSSATAAAAPPASSPWAPAPALEQSLSTLSVQSSATDHTSSGWPPAPTPASAPPRSSAAVTSLERYNQLLGITDPPRAAPPAPAPAPTPAYNIWSTSAAPPVSAARPIGYQDFLRAAPEQYGHGTAASLLGGGGADVPQHALYNAMAVAADTQEVGSPDDNDVESLMNLVLCRS